LPSGGQRYWGRSIDIEVTEAPDWAQWDTVAVASGAGVFLTSAWLRSWIDSFVSSEVVPYIVELRDGSELVGGFPFVRRAGVVSRLEALGGGASAPDHIAPIARPGSERAVARAILQHLFERRPADLLALDGLSDAGDFASGLIDHVGHHGGTIDGIDCPAVSLPDTYDDYLMKRSRNFRSGATRKRRRLSEAGVSFETVEGRQEVEATMERLVELHLAWRSERGRRSTFERREMQTFVGAAALELDAVGRLRLHRLRSADGVIAAICCFADDDAVSFYCSGHDPA